MSTSSPAFVGTLIAAIPAEEGATLVARVGEVAKITSSAGSVDVGSIALTMETIDELTSQLLPADDLQTLREAGTAQGEFVAPNGAGQFAFLAAATAGDRWIEVRRRALSAATSAPAVASPEPPSEATLVAELLSRSSSRDVKPATAASSRVSAQPPAAAPPVAAAAPVATPVPVAAPVPAVGPQNTQTAAMAAAPAEQAAEPADPADDLRIPANFDFANATFNQDDLAVPGGLLDAAAPSQPAADTVRPQSKSKAVAAAILAQPSFGERIKSSGRLPILLAAAIVLAVGLPSAGWFMWTRQPTTVPVTTAPPAARILRSRRLSSGPRPLTLVTPVAAATVNAPNVPPPAPTPAPPAEPALRAPAPVVNHAPASGFAIQVAAVHERGEADRMAAKLSQQGYSAYVVSGDGAAAGYYRVRIGAFPTRHAADEVAKKIEVAEGAKPWIIQETR
jgi:cell division septation protein DedD